MPVPSSGQLRLRADINQEINGNNTDDNVSLGTLSNDAGFSEPDSMSEFYGYSSTTAPDVGSLSTSSVTTTSMRINATLIDDGGYTLSLNPYASQYVKFYFGTNSNVTSNSVYGATLSSGTSGKSGSTYYLDRTGLSSATTYYFGFYAQNPDGNDIVTGSQATATPSLGISGSPGGGYIAGASSWTNAADALANCTTGTSSWANFQNVGASCSLQGNSSTPSSISWYAYCNWNPYPSLGSGGVPTLTNNNSSPSYSANVSVQYIIGVYASCGSGRTTYLRGSKSGYQTYYQVMSYTNLGS